MNGAVCPACGVAVVPGYVRCPKCRKRLPRRPTAVEGGTAVESEPRNLPLIASLAAAVLLAGGIIAYFALRDRGSTAGVAAPVNETDETLTAESDTTANVEAPTDTAAAPRIPTAGDVAAELERQLKRQRLWATVTVVGVRADVRSGSCNDPAMAPLLDAAAPAFKAAGLTKLRCVEQSGQVVSDRDL